MESSSGVQSGNDGSASSAPGGITLLIAVHSDVRRQIFGRYCEILYQPVELVENGLEAVNAYKKEPGRFRSILLDLSMPVMSGSGAAQEIREFEEAHNIRRAVIVGLQRHLSSSHLPNYFNGGFDAIVISHSSIKFFYEFLCGPPETNIFVQYGCLTEEEQQWYSQRYERYHVGCEGSLTTSYGVQTPGLYTSVMPAQTLPRYVTARRREASIFSFRASKYKLTEDTNEDMAE